MLFVNIEQAARRLRLAFLAQFECRVMCKTKKLVGKNQNSAKRRLQMTNFALFSAKMGALFPKALSR